MTGNEISAISMETRQVSAAGDVLCAPPRPPLPVPSSRIEGEAVIPDDDDPWLEDEESDDDGPAPERPFWNR